MSLVQELISESYNTPFPRETDSFDSFGSKDFMFAVEVPSNSNIKKTSDEEAKGVHDCRYPFRLYTHGVMDEWFKEEYDSILYLSLEDIDNVRKKWRKIKNDPLTFGTLLMITLLDDAPETAEKMPANPGVLYNGVMVYDSITLRSAKRKAKLLNNIIKYIDLPEYVTAITHKTGMNMSFNEKKLDKSDFKALHSAIMKTVTTYYKMNNTREIIASLEKTFWIVLGLIEDASHWNDFGTR